MPRPRSHRAIAVLMPAITLAVATGCGNDTDPFAVPACTQIPAAAIRAAATDLGTVPGESPRTGPGGAEYGHLPASGDQGRSYDCFWPVSNPKETNDVAFAVVVELVEPQTYSHLTSTLPTRTGARPLTAHSPGRGWAWPENGHGSAEWLCPRFPGAYGTQRLRVSVTHPKHPQDPTTDAKTLAEAIVPRIGCQSGPSPTAAQSSPTPSH
jgi:hypothetical protein